MKIQYTLLILAIISIGLFLFIGDEDISRNIEIVKRADLVQEVSVVGKPSPATKRQRRLHCNPVNLTAAPASEASMARNCLWCGAGFRARENGGKFQRFCRTSCRRAFHQALRRWALHQWEVGQVTTTTLRRLEGS